MIFKSINHSRTSDAVVEQMERLILEGVLRSGDRLPPERELAMQLEVSRPVLRDALKDLEDRKLLKSRHRGGTYVAEVVGMVFADQIFDLVRRHPKAQSDYFEFRRDMEGIIAEHAAIKATDADRLILGRIMEAMRQHHRDQDLQGESAADLEFHQAIVDASHNIMLLHTMRSCYKLLSEGLFFSRIRFFEWPGVRDLLMDQHEQLYHAIMERQPKEARKAAEDHIAYVEQTLAHTQQAGSWEEISRMRLQRLSDQGGFSPPEARDKMPDAKTGSLAEEPPPDLAAHSPSQGAGSAAPNQTSLEPAREAPSGAFNGVRR
ncbi:FCD domain-containing protein [uncultured Cohaesibacter sp.]|uniref:FadR/GntR family transcriptional regulator n=1 Tax=uncultured Cohaesibacter sp. TaxID=1002546 RepID=UPI0029C658DE|nr:FCD domain-containing protein [uncultured Cohaesibacter sp.]